MSETSDNQMEQTAGEGVDPAAQPGTAAEEAGIVDQQAFAAQEAIEQDTADDSEGL